MFAFQGGESAASVERKREHMNVVRLQPEAEADVRTGLAGEDFSQ